MPVPVPVFKFFRVGLAGLFISSGFAQSYLSLEDAINLAIGKNYQLSISHDQTKAAANNVTSGQGGFLPSASANLTQVGKINGRDPQTRLGVSANWLVFDGFQTYHAVQKLKSQERSTLLDERLTLESLIESVMTEYYDIVQQKQKLGAIQELLAVSEERAKLAHAKLEIGAGSRLELFQSQADLNQDSSNYLNQDASLRHAKARLNQLLTREPAMDFQVSDSIPLNVFNPVEEWRKILPENNTSIAAARSRREAATASVKVAQGQWLPSLNSGLAYSAAPKALNHSAKVQGSDLTYNLNFSIPLFNKLATSTGITRSRVELRQEETRVKLAESNAQAEFEKAQIQYQSGLQLIRLEDRNLQVARLQAEGAQERYRLGASTPLEFRDAQTKLLDAQVRLITARQKAKQAETALQKLAGLLVKQAPVIAEGK